MTTIASLPVRFAITTETIGREKRAFGVSLGRDNRLPPLGDGDGMRSVLQAHLDPFVSEILQSAWRQDAEVFIELDALRKLVFIQVADGWRHYGDHYRATVRRDYDGSLFRREDLIAHWQSDDSPFGSLLDRTIDLGSFGEAFDVIRHQIPLTKWEPHGLESIAREAMRHGWLAHLDWARTI